MSNRFRDDHPWMEGEQMRQSVLDFIDRVALDESQGRDRIYVYGPLMWDQTGRFGPAGNNPRQVLERTAWRGTPDTFAAAQVFYRTVMWLDMVGAISTCIELWTDDHTREMVLHRERLETLALEWFPVNAPTDILSSLRRWDSLAADAAADAAAWLLGSFPWVTAEAMKRVILTLPLEALDENLPTQNRVDFMRFHVGIIEAGFRSSSVRRNI